jgi:hypothetical protein
MSESLHLLERSTTAPPGLRKQVLDELEAILSSYHFRGSKRYPSLLRYVVTAALDGRTSDLKERTLGVEVFGRHPEYDTGSDPVVRVSAGEVRKRIAQYYHENAEHSHLQIDLPLGSYVPEFLLRSSEAPAEKILLELPGPAVPPAVRRKSRRLLLAELMILALCMLLLGIYAVDWHLRSPLAKMTIQDALWAPIVNSRAPTFIVVGPGRPDSPTSTTRDADFNNFKAAYHPVSLATSVAMTHVAGLLRTRGKPFTIKESSDTSLSDIRNHPLVLIGARNNEWTMRLVEHLRFHFHDAPVAQIQDSQNPQNADWMVNIAQLSTSVTTDYAIVARFNDSTTEAPVLVIAGLGPYGTQAASEFVDSPEYLSQILKKAPIGWENQNFEMVLKTEVIGTQAGPPELLAVTVW